jgi:N-dimethylarginine dimethylaminohydrolase
MQEKIKLIEVNETEAKRFACNAVVLGKHVIVPTECPELTKDLEAKGFTVHACNMNEFLKAGGACKCLTLRLT